VSNSLGLMQLIVLSVMAMLVACSNTTIDQVRYGYTGVGASEAVVVLGRRYKSDTETEVDFISCVGSGLKKGTADITVVTEQEFADSLYPWFEPRTAPIRIEGLKNLLKQADIAERVASLGVRYIIWIDGSTEKTHSTGSIACSIGPGGGGCLGFGTWDDEARYEASVWDFNNLTSVGPISANAKGTSYMPAIVVPIPLLARVKSNACKALGDQLKSFLLSTE